MGREVNKMILHGKCYENDKTGAKWRLKLLRHTWVGREGFLEAPLGFRSE